MWKGPTLVFKQVAAKLTRVADSLQDRRSSPWGESDVRRAQNRTVDTEVCGTGPIVVLSREWNAVHKLVHKLTRRAAGRRICVVLHDGESASHPGLRFSDLDDFRPPDHELRMLHDYREWAEGWAEKLGVGEAVVIDGIDLGRSSRFDFAARVFQPELRRAECVRRMVEQLRPSAIYADRSYSRLLTFVSIPHHAIQSVQPAEISIAKLVCSAAISFLYNLGYRVVYAKLAGLSSRVARFPRPLIFVGEDVLFRQLRPLLTASGARDSLLLVKTMYRPSRKIHEPRCHGFGQSTYAEALLSGRQWLRACSATLRLYRVLLPQLWRYGRRRPAEPLQAALPQLVRFLLRGFPTAVKYRFIAETMYSRWTPDAVFLATGATWTSETIASVLRKQGVRLLSGTHGAVGEVLSYRSAVDCLYVAGEHDRELLAAAGENADCRVLGHYYPPLSFIDRPQTFLLLPSSHTLEYRSEDRFLRETLAFLAELERDSGEGEVQPEIVIKVHYAEPMRPVQQAVRHWTGKPGRIRITRENLHGELGAARLVFLMPGTVLADCLYYRKPFFLYDARWYDDRCIYGSVPQILRYRNRDALRHCYDQSRPLQQQAMEQLREQYFGRPLLDPQQAFQQEILGAIMRAAVSANAAINE